ncbi:DMT family transporter [Microbispora bryophytorum]|uniref:Transporter n=1 Tax=Microbispora bryophytorum TaxID=1460882 RepID=A0A8H9GTB6_9ACTN|nr:EamA family transporter [Microbispora bryophytorum]MBD3135466.1 EamA family transporter [Microbispora bryophytorum]TQS09656.1 EamA family transporter [Microbispora bryophytorum]GGN97792.1 transporter [Microbispora bryophytorum]
MNSRSGPLAVVAAAVLWGTAGTVGTLASAASVSLAAARLVLGGALLGTLALVTYRRTSNGNVPARRSPIVSLILGAVAVAAYQLCYFAAVARTGVAIGTVVAIGSGPVFTGLLSWIAGRERPSGRWALATAAAVAGCAVLVTGGRGTGGVGAGGVDAGGVALALLGGLLYAFYAVVAARAIGGGMASGVVMGALFGGAAVLMLPVLVLTGPGWLAHPGGLLTALYLGCATTGLAYLLYGRGLRTTPVATAATLALAEPAVAALLGVVALREHLSPVSWAGLALLALGLVVVALPAGARDPDAVTPGTARAAAGSRQ